MVLLRLSLVLALLSAGCSVDRSALEGRLFFCDDDEDCGSGAICVIGLGALLGTHEGYCVARCGCEGCPECSGHCTARGECLATCDPAAESERCAEGLHCLSTALGGLPPGLTHGTAGVCTPLETCRTSADCAEDRLCPSEYQLDDYYPLERALCVGPRCEDDEACAEGWFCLSYLGLSACFPGCGSDSACPPGSTCVERDDSSVGVCVPGTTPYGSCRDATSCLAGTCFTEAEESACVIPCESDRDCIDSPFEASAVPPWLRLCRETAHGGICSVAVLGLPCENSGDCGDWELSCEDLGRDDGARGCTMECDEDEDCAPLDGYCERVGLRETCLPLGLLGWSCTPVTDAHCSDDLVCGRLGDLNHCTRVCASDEECFPYGGYCDGSGQLATCQPLGLAGDRCEAGNDESCYRGLSCVELIDPRTAERDTYCTEPCTEEWECWYLWAECRAGYCWALDAGDH